MQKLYRAKELRRELVVDCQDAVARRERVRKQQIIS